MNLTEESLINEVRKDMGKNWTQWPKIKDLSKKFRCRQQEVIDFAEDIDDMDLIVGFRTEIGHGEFDSIGECRLEFYGDEMPVDPRHFSAID